jgi:hypothetical protein
MFASLEYQFRISVGAVRIKRNSPKNNRDTAGRSSSFHLSVRDWHWARKVRRRDFCLWKEKQGEGENNYVLAFTRA